MIGLALLKVCHGAEATLRGREARTQNKADVQLYLNKEKYRLSIKTLLVTSIQCY